MCARVYNKHNIYTRMYTHTFTHIDSLQLPSAGSQVLYPT